MHKIAIVSDSTAGLTAEYVSQHDIATIPLYVKMGADTLRDGVDITSAQFYARLPNEADLPTTSQPSVGDFQTLFAKLLEAGAESIVTAHLSAGISGTINSATLAAQEFPDTPIAIVDSMCAVAAHKFCIEAGVLAREAGLDHDGVAAAMQAVVEAQRTIFAVDTLEYLYKGGRIGGAARLVGSLLQFKPLLHFVDGKIDALERVRTTKRATKRAIELMGEWLGDQPLRGGIMHTDDLDRAKEAGAALGNVVDLVDVQYTEISPVIGTHSGPGTLGFCCVPERLFKF